MKRLLINSFKWKTQVKESEVTTRDGGQYGGERKNDGSRVVTKGDKSTKEQTDISDLNREDGTGANGNDSGESTDGSEYEILVF